MQPSHEFSKVLAYVLLFSSAGQLPRLVVAFGWFRLLQTGVFLLTNISCVQPILQTHQHLVLRTATEHVRLPQR